MEPQAAELKQERERIKVSRQELAAKLAVTYSMVQRIEEGWKEIPEGFVERYRQALIEISEDRHRRALAAAGRPASKQTRKAAPAAPATETH